MPVDDADSEPGACPFSKHAHGNRPTALQSVQPLLCSVGAWPGRPSITSPPIKEQMPTAARPGGYVPKCCLTNPISHGDAEPARLPMDTIIAMPTAAVSFEKL